MRRGKWYVPSAARAEERIPVYTDAGFQTYVPGAHTGRQIERTYADGIEYELEYIPSVGLYAVRPSGWNTDTLGLRVSGAILEDHQRPMRRIMGEE